MYKMSIIIPIYNVENYIEECFKSIIKQKNMNDVEVICIDDGSTDNSGRICDKYAKIDKRFKVVHQKNAGVAVARNVGLDIAKGKYIAWIDPDDYIADNWYEKINIIIKKDVDVIFFDYIFLVDNVLKKVRYEDSSGYIKREKFLRELVLDKKIQSQLWSKVIKKDLFYNIRIPTELNLLEDYAIMHYLIERAETIYYVADYLYFYRIRKNSLTSNKISIDADYKCYLIAKERYRYLIEKNMKVPKIDYLLKAFCVCNRFYQLKIFTKEEENKFKICKKELKNNIKDILLSQDVNIKLKIKIIACRLNILKSLLRINNIWKIIYK